MFYICVQVDFLRKTHIPVAPRHIAAIRTSDQKIVCLCNRVQSTDEESAPPLLSQHSFQEKKARNIFPVDVWQRGAVAKFNSTCRLHVTYEVTG